MKITSSQIIALVVLLAICSSISVAQGIPDIPPPAPIPDPGWDRLQSLTRGSPILITLDDGRIVHCLFASVTNAYLICSPSGNPPGVGFRFDHAQVIGVDLDFSGNQPASLSAHERNYHPAWISSMIAGGFIVGLVAVRSTDAANAAKAGMIGAGIVGAIGAPLAFLPHPQMTPFPASSPRCLYGAALQLRFRRQFHR